MKLNEFLKEEGSLILVGKIFRIGRDYFKVKYTRNCFESEIEVPLTELSEGRGVKLNGLPVFIFSQNKEST